MYSGREQGELVTTGSSVHIPALTQTLSDDVALCAARLGVKPGDDFVVRKNELIAIPRYHAVYLIAVPPEE